MFDIGWSELLVIGVVALVVIGPKELPGVLRSVGQMIGKLRRMAGEFQGQFQEALREAELDGLKKEFTSFADDAQKSISGALPSNPLLDIENEVKAATASIDGPKPEATTEPASAEPHAFEDFPEPDVKLPPPPEPVEISPAKIEEEVRAAAADLDGHVSSALGTPAPTGTQAAAGSAPAAAAAKASAPTPAATEIASGGEAAPAANIPPAVKPRAKRKPPAELPEPLSSVADAEIDAAVADLDAAPGPAGRKVAKAASTKAAPKPRARSVSPTELPEPQGTPAESELGEAVADLDGPPARKPARKAKASDAGRRAATKSRDEEGPGA